MTRASVYCTRCKRYWRPDRIARTNKYKRAPDGGPSGQCKLCKNELYRASYARIKANPPRWAARQALRASYNARVYWSMTPEQRHADAVRRAVPQRAYRLRRRFTANALRTAVRP